MPDSPKQFKFKSIEEASVHYLNAMPLLPPSERRRMQAAFFAGAMSAFFIDNDIQGEVQSGKLSPAEWAEKQMKVREDLFALIEQRAKEAQERLQKRGQ